MFRCWCVHLKNDGIIVHELIPPSFPNLIETWIGAYKFTRMAFFKWHGVICNIIIMSFKDHCSSKTCTSMKSHLSIDLSSPRLTPNFLRIEHLILLRPVQIFIAISHLTIPWWSRYANFMQLWIKHVPNWVSHKPSTQTIPNWHETL